MIYNKAICTGVFRATPGEEIIDLDDQFKPGFQTTDDIIEPKENAKKSDTQVRHENRPKDRGLLMIYPLQSNLDMTDEEYFNTKSLTATSYLLRSKEQVFAFTLVFPLSPTEKGSGKYMINPLKKKK